MSSERTVKVVPKMIIFDWDGTLVNSRDYVVQCANQVLVGYGIQSWDTLKKTGIVSNQKPFKKNLETIFADSFQEAFNMYRAIYIKEFKNCVTIANDAYKLIDFFAKHQCEINIASNKDSFLLQEEVKHFFPDHKFQNVLGYDDCQRHKPHPEIIEKLCKPYKNLNRSTQVIFIGDSKVDLECAKAGGCFPIQINQKKNNLNIFSHLDNLFKIKTTGIEKG